MEKAREFLNIYNNSNDYREKFFSLYNALFILLKDDLWERVEGVGIKKERMVNTILLFYLIHITDLSGIPFLVQLIGSNY